MGEWQPIETAPKDGTPVLAFCTDRCGQDICSYSTNTGTTLCLYHAHAAGLAAFGEGHCIVEWGGAWTDSWEDGGGSLPDWWFRVGSEFEEAANPTHWMPLPAAPAA